MRAEISYDLIMRDDMAFAEGCYRLPGRDWQVVIVSASNRNIAAPQTVNSEWESGASGVVVHLPREIPINASNVEQVLGNALGVSEWVRVQGPNSMDLR